MLSGCERGLSAHIGYLSLQRSHDKTLDRSIERLRTSLRSLSKCVKDGSQISKTDIIEETDKDSKRNT